MKIAISGIGGVGAYLGGLLAKEFENSNDVEIYFIARGENEKAIRAHGLQLQTANGNYIVHPKLTTSVPEEIGVVDFFISCTKSYDLVENIRQCNVCIDGNTTIIPLQNGVESKRVIEEIYPANEVCDGCVYIISKLIEPGVVKESGNVKKFFFGSAKMPDEKLEKFVTLCKQAGIDAALSENIQQVIWEKFIFISVIATVTCYLDECIGNILADENKKAMLLSLLSEIKMVADKKKIALPDNILQLTLDKMKSIPFETTSSMHADFQRKKNTELESLTGYVVRTALEFGICDLEFEKMYDALRERSKRF